MTEQFMFKKELLEIANTLEVTTPGTGGKFLYAVAQYGIYGEFVDEDPVIVAAMAGARSLVGPSAEKAKTGRPRQYDPQLIADLARQGWRTQDIAKHLGCSLRTVQRALEQ